MIGAGAAGVAAAGVADGAVAVQPQASTARITRRIMSAIFMDRELWHMPDKSDWSGGGRRESYGDSMSRSRQRFKKKFPDFSRTPKKIPDFLWAAKTFWNSFKKPGKRKKIPRIIFFIFKRAPAFVKGWKLFILVHQSEHFGRI